MCFTVFGDHLSVESAVQQPSRWGGVFGASKRWGAEAERRLDQDKSISFSHEVIAAEGKVLPSFLGYFASPSESLQIIPV